MMIYFRPYLWLTVFSFIALLILLGLGTWQVQRLQWKLTLIESVETRTTAAPQNADHVWRDYDGEPMSIEYTRVQVRGTFDHSKEAHLYRLKPGGEPGFNIITRLVRGGAPDVLINRGHVPLTNKLPETRLEGQVEGEMTIIGLVRVPGERASFTADNQPAENMWYYYDMPALSDYLGSVEPLPLIIEADAAPNPGGLPQGGNTRIQFSNDHLGYAITWYGMVIALVCIYFVFHAQAGRLKLNVASDDQDR